MVTRWDSDQYVVCVHWHQPQDIFLHIEALETHVNPVDSPVQQLTVPIGVGPISLVDPINSPQLVTRNRQGNLAPAEFHRWSGSLADNFSAVLADEIAGLLGNKEVFAYPWISGLHPVYQIKINLRQFEGELNHEAVLKADWLLIDKTGKRIGRVKRTALTEPVQGKSHTDLVTALERNMAKLAVEIADLLRSCDTSGYCVDLK
jgi:uncharacterized lipoprotein YmbA